MFTKQIIVIASALATYASASCLHGTSLLPRAELPGGKVAVSNFGYTGDRGPLNWAGLETANTACASSKVQSPINIDDSIGLAQEAPVVKIDSVQNAEFENLGTTLEVIVNGTTTFAGKEFSLRQFHFHTPSEHRIAEEYFPLEMHMVHEAADGSGGIAVIAVVFQLSEDGSTTELLTSVTEKLSEIATPGTVTETGALDFAPLIDHVQTTPLFQYTGSLTTPPCAEGLTFLVTQQPLPLNVATYNALKGIIKFNSRYTQNTLGQTNLLEVGAGTLGCVVNGTDEIVEDIISTTVLVEIPTTEVPVATTEVAHPEPAPATTTTETLLAPTEEVAHPDPVTTSLVEEPPAATNEPEHPVVTTTPIQEEVPVATEEPVEHPEVVTTTVEEIPVATEKVEHPEVVTTTPIQEEVPVATEEPVEHPEVVTTTVEEIPVATEKVEHPEVVTTTPIQEEVPVATEEPVEHPEVVTTTVEEIPVATEKVEHPEVVTTPIHEKAPVSTGDPHPTPTPKSPKNAHTRPGSSQGRNKQLCILGACFPIGSLKL